MKFLIAIISLLVLTSAVQIADKTTLFENIENMGKEFIVNEVQKQLVGNSINTNTCGFASATQCLANLKTVFTGCTEAIAQSGASILSDIVCIKSLWHLRNTEFKQCYGCVCEFTKFIHFNFHICQASQALTQENPNVFETLMTLSNLN